MQTATPGANGQYSGQYIFLMHSLEKSPLIIFTKIPN